jgi:hypothetical protein
MRKTLLLISLALLLTTGSAFARVTITIQNNDGAGLGFNDQTPATPIGGNPGTTLGEQRLNAFKFAAGLWGEILESQVPIVIRANFSPINDTSSPCTATSAILGQAGPTSFISDFSAAPLAHVGYPIALANAISGTDLNGSVPEINATFNSLVDNATCLGNTNWYYGFDANHGSNIDLVSVLLHEFGHGLGFVGNTSTNSGNFGSGGTPSVFDVHIFDNQSGQTWPQMSPQARLVSMINTGHLGFNGDLTKAHAATLLKPVTVLAVNTPSSASYEIGVASFGGSVANINLSGDVVAVQDGIDATSTSTLDACQTPLTNASALTGKWALVDRGNCNFTVKAKNVQDAGAIGIIVADNKADTCQPPSMSGDDPTITIPVISVTQADGAILRGQANANLNVTLHFDPTRLAGATAEGLPKLYAPCTVSPGSSIYHFDVTANPSLLMEPFISSDLKHVPDLTLDELRDIGWTISTPQGRPLLKRR